MTTLELRAASKAFAEAEINATLRVQSGELLVLLGPSGCGKSTVLRMIAGLVEPDSGDVLLDGRSMTGVPPERRNAAMVFQAHALFPFRTVEENVAYGLKVRKVAVEDRRRRTAAALEMVQLDGFAHRWPGELSGGERQRVALARAIVVEPAVLLLDEPLSSLDPVLRHDLQRLIRLVQPNLAMTAVFVTHDRDEAKAMGDQVAVMLDGRIRQIDAPAVVFDHPASDAVARFLAPTSVQS